MIRFVQFMGKVLLLLFFTATALDFAYTFAKTHSQPRTKIDLITTTKNSTFDIVILGSSRAVNHIDSQVFVDHGYTTFNFGMRGAKLPVNALQLKLMLENNYTIKTILLQVDTNLEPDFYTDLSRPLFMPYWYSSETLRNHFKVIEEQSNLMYIPFYRYMLYDAQIGFREFFFTAIQKKTTCKDNYGFEPLEATTTDIGYFDTTNFPKRNLAYEEIKAICKSHGIRLISITTPVCRDNHADYFDRIQSLYPEIIDFHTVIKDDEHFVSCGHMNEKGAKLFTKVVFDSIFKQ
jgi:hypothetical protein